MMGKGVWFVEESYNCLCFFAHLFGVIQTQRLVKNSSGFFQENFNFTQWAVLSVELALHGKHLGLQRYGKESGD